MHSMLRIFTLGIVLLIFLPVTGFAGIGPGPLPGPQDHLKCYKVKDNSKDVHKNIQNKVVELNSLQFGIETCKIVGNYREFCVPVSKKVLNGNDNGDHSGPGQVHPFIPATDRICYEIRNCTGRVPPETNVKDQFGQRDIEFQNAFTLCTPAEKCNPTCTENGQGTACETRDGQDGECLDTCTCAGEPVRTCEDGSLCGEECITANRDQGICEEIDIFGNCECIPNDRPPDPCEDLLCGDRCTNPNGPPGNVGICEDVDGDGSCECVPEDLELCGDSDAPECGGPCPIQGDNCVPIPPGNGCECSSK